ncbi:hypothetical protein SAMN04487965_2657 [Microbulbifer donghaiensis]|uniref:Spore coat protein U domain-containing protein n=1 Tax=Microbulbifer donghaiensis TaxID=494016 RepID=A0A1M5ECN2_9GAMM|nr:hypothetical protein [Microbulbifer donghaiensis]SHF76920.1 hypothetical protein SAMN04487965_2657 [Microbulbifer donghaiensis]
MKGLLALGASAALLAAAATYAGVVHEEEDCCKDEIDIELLLEIECECDIVVTGGLSYNLAPTQNAQRLNSLIEVDCNVPGEPEVTVTSTNAGFLVGQDFGEMIPYGVTIQNTALLNTQLVVPAVIANWNNNPHAVGVTLQADPNGFSADMYSDIIVVEAVAP